MHKILVTQFARDNLNYIFSYYKAISNISVTNKIKSELKTTMLSLEDEKLNFQEDEFLKVLGKEHRRIVCGNFKIIYYRDNNKQITYGSDVLTQDKILKNKVVSNPS